MRNTSFTMCLALALSVAAAGAGAQSADHGHQMVGAAADTTSHQHGSARGQRGERQKMLLRGITLSPSQHAAIKAMREQNKQGFAAKRERGDTAGMAARRADMKQRSEQHIAALRTILTPEQRTQFDRNVAELRAQHPKHGGL